MEGLEARLAHSPPRRVLVIRLSAIGDIIMAGILPKALKRRWPEAHITWLCQPAGAELAAANPHVDRVVVWDRGAWLDALRRGRLIRLAALVGGLRRELRAGRFDLVLDLQGLAKSGVLAALAGGDLRVGLGSREGSGLLMTHTVDRGARVKRIGAEYWQLADLLGAPLPPEEGAVRLYDEAARTRAAALLREAGMGGDYAVICPFTTRPQKHWFEGRWAALADGLAREAGVDVVMLGGPADGPAADRIAASSSAMRSLVGRTSLTDCAAVIAGARVLVGVDTGLTHMGMLSPTPAIALFGSTAPYLEPPKPGDSILYKDLPCAPCKRRPTCGGRFDCMRALEVEEVLGYARAAMGRAP